MAKTSPSRIFNITAAGLVSIRGEPNVVIIDVRDEDERSKDGHIAGSLYFGSESFFEKFQALIEAVKSKFTVVFYCPFGLGRAPFCAKYLESYLAKDAPKNIMVLSDGFIGWKASGKPVCHCKEIPCKGGS